jgi:DUF971 family protein
MVAAADPRTDSIREGLIVAFGPRLAREEALQQLLDRRERLQREVAHHRSELAHGLPGEIVLHDLGTGSVELRAEPHHPTTLPSEIVDTGRLRDWSRMTAMSAPVTIDVRRDHGLTLTWADGATSRFGLEELRLLCPCAECRTRRDRGLPVWRLPSSAEPLRIVDAKLVGAWGLGITWDDGHSTGIYSWELLRPAGPV